MHRGLGSARVGGVDAPLAGQVAPVWMHRGLGRRAPMHAGGGASGADGGAPATDSPPPWSHPPRCSSCFDVASVMRAATPRITSSSPGKQGA